MTRIRLSDERRKSIHSALSGFYGDVFDRDLSDYQAERLVEFFLQHLGPPVYNQGIQDARAYLLDKLDDIEGDIAEPTEAA